MKERNFDFSRHTQKSPTVTKQKIVDSLRAFAKEKRGETFTQKQYDAWRKRILCTHQISVRFGGWSKAMERAELIPKWNPTKNPMEMVEAFMDCWEEQDDCPTEKVFVEYLKKIDSPHSVGVYKRYFGGLRRLSQRIVDFHEKRISEKQLLTKYDRPRARRTPIAQSLRYEILNRDGFKCRSCGRSSAADGVKLEVDHIVPVYAGGNDESTNLQTLCEDCNKGKSARLLSVAENSNI